MGWILWDKIDRKPVGASQPLYFASEDEAELHVERMSREEVAAGRFALVSVPE